MNQVLGRGESRPWATKWPVSSLGAMLIAGVLGIGIFTFRNLELWTPLQQWYWTEYLTTKSFPKAHGEYQMIVKMDAKGKQLMALDADVVPGPMQAAKEEHDKGHADAGPEPNRCHTHGRLHGWSQHRR